jgi:nucleoside-diphosphate-sugar epimerase
LITGVGLVGAQVARLEQDAGRTPILLDIAPNRRALADFVDLDNCVVLRGDLLNPLDLAAAVKEHGVTRIAHTAAYPNLTAGALVAPLAAVQVNILGTTHVLEVARLFNLERVTICSSSALYLMAGGEDAGAEGREEAWPRPSTLYATTKQATENIALNYSASYGFPAVCLRFATVYGPWALGGGGVGTTAIEDLLRTAMRGETVEIDPTPREWLYSKDAARAVHLATWNDGAPSGVFNVSEGITNSGDDLARAITKLFPDAVVNVGGASITAAIPSMTMPVMDTSRTRDLLGFATEYTVAEAFADYYEWLQHAPSQTSP